MTPYHDYVSALARLVRDGKQLPLGTFPTPSHPAAPGRHRPLVAARRRLERRAGELLEFP